MVGNVKKREDAQAAHHKKMQQDKHQKNDWESFIACQGKFHFLILFYAAPLGSDL
jgi:DNA-binding GntR family transcriptional regulator